MSEYEIRIGGVRECVAALDRMEREIDRATIAALKSSQNLAKKYIRSGMRGRPRYDRRGAIGSSKSVAAVNLHLNPSHVEKSGGPGRLTGHLIGAVGGVKKPKKKADGYSGGVGVGGPASVTNMYRFNVNAKYPFVEPGVKKASSKMPEIWEKAWDRAIRI